MGDNETIRNHAAFIWSVADLLRGDSKLVGVREGDPADGGAPPPGLRARADEGRRARAV